jgi:hypothetical protein
MELGSCQPQHPRLDAHHDLRENHAHAVVTVASDPVSAVLAWLTGPPVSASRFRRRPTYWVDPSTSERGEAGCPEGPRLPGGQMTASDGSVSSVEACRSTLWMSTVTYRMAAPISSATSSTLNRRSPSSVFQLHCSRRPLTMTRAPSVWPG